MHTRPAHPPRARLGRLLVECLVAMLLLNTSAVVVVALARGATRSTQSARLTTYAWTLAVGGIESSVARNCATGEAAGSEALPQVDALWRELGHAGWREREVQVTLNPSALATASADPRAGAMPVPLTLRSARSCP